MITFCDKQLVWWWRVTNGLVTMDQKQKLLWWISLESYTWKLFAITITVDNRILSLSFNLWILSLSFNLWSPWLSFAMRMAQLCWTVGLVLSRASTSSSIIMFVLTRALPTFGRSAQWLRQSAAFPTTDSSGLFKRSSTVFKPTCISNIAKKASSKAVIKRTTNAWQFI